MDWQFQCIQNVSCQANTKIKEDLKNEAAKSRGLDVTVGQQKTDAVSCQKKKELELKLNLPCLKH